MVTPAAALPAQLLAAALREDPSRPLLTFYDDGSGERVELSVVTFANWVAKTANFLRDDLGASSGDHVSIRLPAHWQSAVWLSACWALGAVPRVGEDVPEPAGARKDASAALATPAPAAVAVVARDDVDPAPLATELVVLGLGPFGLPRPGHETPAKVTSWTSSPVDYDSEIHGHGDSFVASDADQHQVALEVAGDSLSGADLAALTEQAQQAWGLQPGDRVLGVSPLDSVPAILAMLLVPLAAGSGAVMCRHLDPAQLVQRVRAERVISVLRAPELESTLVRRAVPSYLGDLGSG